jgi:hypothetical protein
MLQQVDEMLMKLRSRHAGSSGIPLYPFESQRNDPSYNYLSSNPHYSHSHHTNGAPPVAQNHHVILFDPEHPQIPHPTLMRHFIQIFFEQFGTEFPFISYDETMGQFFEQSLAPLLSNCIASLAVRYVSHIVLMGAMTYGGRIGFLASQNSLHVDFTM